MRAVNDGPLDLGSGEPLPATGRRIELPTAWFLQLNEEGKIVSEHDYFDTALILRQLGVG
jgi:predicted ester cyclase